MEWRKGRKSDNVVESDGSSPIMVGDGMRLPLRRVTLGFRGLIILLIVSWLLGLNPFEVLGLLSGSAPGQYANVSQNTSPVTSADPQVTFVSVILGSTEDVWNSYFHELGREYEIPKLQIFNRHVRSGCGLASEAMGPFYCTSDHRVYLDLSFFEELETRFHAKGDFARAYVIAHEIGHHVQALLGTTSQMERAVRAGAPLEGADGLSVRLELQADCLAGIWAKKSEQQLSWLQEGDIESALNAAHQIGDDLLETQSQGYSVPDSFTHGTSAQRVMWFKQGFVSGDLGSCDTFNSSL